jgi:hypothetical protein
MKFIIHNSKSKPWNNSCEFVSITQFQHYRSSPIHLKDDAKQNKDKINNNKHKQDTTKGKEVLTYGCVHLIVVSWKENLPS